MTATSSGARWHSTTSPRPAPGSPSRPTARVSTCGCPVLPDPGKSSTPIPMRRRRPPRRSGSGAATTATAPARGSNRPSVNGMASGYFFYGGRTLDFPIPDHDRGPESSSGPGWCAAPRGPRCRLAPRCDHRARLRQHLRHRSAVGERRRRPWRREVDDGYFSVPNFGAYSQVEWQAACHRRCDARPAVRPGHVPLRELHAGTASPSRRRHSTSSRPDCPPSGTPDSATSLYASVGRGFEVPAIGELSAGPGARLSESLRPKSLWNYEVGARRIVGGRVLLEGSVFYADVRGEFVPAQRQRRAVRRTPAARATSASSWA